jgi:hypothetical protein
MTMTPDTFDMPAASAPALSSSSPPCHDRQLYRGHNHGVSIIFIGISRFFIGIIVHN